MYCASFASSRHALTCLTFMRASHLFIVMCCDRTVRPYLYPSECSYA